MYIYLIEGKYQVHTVRLNDDIALDFMEGEKLVGIEILDAKNTLQTTDLSKIIFEDITRNQIVS